MDAACVLGQSLGNLLEAGLECHELCLRNACENTRFKVRVRSEYSGIQNSRTTADVLPAAQTNVIAENNAFL